MARERDAAARGACRTQATEALATARVSFTVHPYVIPRDAADASAGEAAAAALGVPAEEVFKTLVAAVDGRAVCALVPASGTLSLKALARAAGGRRARLADPREAERRTGYVTGGISPFGQAQHLEAFVDASALGLEAILMSAGRRGLQLRVAPDALVTIARAVPIAGLGRPRHNCGPRAT